MREKIERQVRLLERAFNDADIPKLMELHTSDTAIFPPDGEAVFGNREASEMWAAGVTKFGCKDIELKPVEIQGAGDFAYELGLYSQSMPAGPETGTYMVIWKKEGETWRVHREVWNLNPGAERLLR
ncbi:MAG: Ketosteroid isomerase [Rhodospirillales bacterium]|jgi:ketosteroid isomerase-like protein|nr:Ketosteroid isomerase [Rhodospirillales bacterium]